MFTGIIGAIGTVTDAQEREGGMLTLRIQADRPLPGLALGASVACSGVCLTATDLGEDWFAVDVSAETRRVTAPHFTPGAKLNLERALRVGDELGGHIVTGHVDGIGVVISAEPEAGSIQLVIEAPAALQDMIAAKGSVTVNGVSLTVNAVEDAGTATRFSINLVPHTVANIAPLKPEAAVNLEADVLARYLQRMLMLREQHL